MSEQLRVDGAEAQLLLAELRHFKDMLGQERIERVIGRKYDAAFVTECTKTYSVQRLAQKRGYPFDLRIGATAVLERALEALWKAAPPKTIWRART